MLISHLTFKMRKLSLQIMNMEKIESKAKSMITAADLKPSKT